MINIKFRIVVKELERDFFDREGEEGWCNDIVKVLVFNLDGGFIGVYVIILFFYLYIEFIYFFVCVRY